MLGVSVLTAGEAMRLMCILLVVLRTVTLMDEGLEVLCFSELMKFDKTDPSHCSSGYVGLFEEHAWQQE